MPTDPTGLEHETPVVIQDTSATERAAFRKCHRRWFLTVVHRLSAPEGDYNLWLGTFVHAGLEAYYRALMEAGWTSEMPERKRRAIHDAAVRIALDELDAQFESSTQPIKDYLGFLWPNVAPTYRELGELGFEMVQRYLDREWVDPIFDEIVDVERRIWVDIEVDDRVVGRLSVKPDVVGRRRGVLSVGDHKTASREMSETQLDLDDQLTAECYAVWRDSPTGEFPEEAVYNGLMKKVPQPPKHNKPLKDGTPVLSKDKSQSTTYQLYYDEVKRLGLDPADYAEILDHFNEVDQGEANPFFKRVRVLRSPAQIDSFERNLLYEWQDMAKVAAEPERAYPNPSPFNCPSCPAKVICMTMQDGGDVETIIKAGYVVGDPRR